MAFQQITGAYEVGSEGAEIPRGKARADGVKSKLYQLFYKGDYIGITKDMQTYLRQAVHCIPASRLIDGSGLFHLPAKVIAERLGWSTSKLYRIERELFQENIIERNTSLNGRRDGQLGYGISLRPLVERYHELTDRIEKRMAEAKAEAEKRHLQRQEVARLRCEITTLFVSGCLPDPASKRLAEAISRWPQRPSSCSHQKISAHLIHLRAVSRWIQKILQKKMNDRSIISDRQYTEKEKEILSKLAANLERRASIRPAQSNEVPDLELVLTPETLLYVQMFEETGNIGQVLQFRGRELGIDERAINNLALTLPPHAAIMVLSILEDAMQRKRNPVQDPNRYLNGLVSRWEKKALNMVKGLQMIAKRRKGRIHVA